MWVCHEKNSLISPGAQAHPILKAHILIQFKKNIYIFWLSILIVFIWRVVHKLHMQ